MHNNEVSSLSVNPKGENPEHVSCGTLLTLTLTLLTLTPPMHLSMVYCAVREAIMLFWVGLRSMN